MKKPNPELIEGEKEFVRLLTNAIEGDILACEEEKRCGLIKQALKSQAEEIFKELEECNKHCIFDSCVDNNCKRFIEIKSKFIGEKK